MSMGLLLLNPIALAAFAAIAAPIVVHLLLRRRATRLPFPSLRFIPPSNAAAVRLRSIADWPLLLVRIAIVGVAERYCSVSGQNGRIASAVGQTWFDDGVESSLIRASLVIVSPGL